MPNTESHTSIRNTVVATIIVSPLEWTDVTENFRYEPNEGESLSMAVVSAVALAHHEGVLEQDWIINNDINPDALDGLFQDGQLNMTLRFEADTTTVTIDADQLARFELIKPPRKRLLGRQDECAV